MSGEVSVIEGVLREQRETLLAAWVQAQLAAPGVRTDLISESELRVESERFLTALVEGVTNDPGSADLMSPHWDTIRDQLTALSRSRATRGFSPTETATFVFSLKKPLFEALTEADGDTAATIWSATQLIDSLGLYTADAYLRTREEVIRRQQDELIELSTPVVKLWQGVVALPLIGTLDSARTQVVMESLLQRIVETDSAIAIIDITGVPTVDTMVAQHLLKAVTAARLMGADCIISGIRPLIAQTIVHLGLDLSEVTTKSSLADAVTVALERTGHQIVRRKTPAAE
ncbi:rsbT co-antagonist protein RsbR [Solirubrobacter pauli]|uniref:RsbT co-antagonist protein RsbR n=1 Tax=Solirubrobacter pauli TaxID=166793 RepID=A0A660L2Q0_9ACTN|nr:STAS domain-containing protein [Solirubrobacter pauli]RKQ87199.1 rsbT co-antagonist protein RsbR [Solirubrobacter pauli]